MSIIQNGPQKIVNNQFITKKRISSGSFGVVYLGQDIHTREYVAIKIEKANADEQCSLERESKFLSHLQNVPQIPKLYYHGVENNQNFMVIQFLGRDLTYYLKTFRKFSLKCVLNIADQVLNILDNVHKKSIVHRDIKPENVLVGRESESQNLYLVDFGISKFYRDEKGHIPLKENKPFIGTTRYASIAAHKGQELSRKDDLESLGYMLIFLIKGGLPWQNLNLTNESEKIKAVGQMKMKMDSLEICKGLPVEFARQFFCQFVFLNIRYLDYVRKLNFKSQPDYKYLQQLFKKLSTLSNFSSVESKFDWDVSQANNSNQKSSESGWKRSGRKMSEEPTSQLQQPIFEFTQLASSIQSEQQARSNFGSSLQEADNPNGNTNGHSLLKMREPKKASQLTLSPVASDRRGDRKQSCSSFNESYGGSEQFPMASILIGFQGSMVSVQSRQSRQSRQSYQSRQSKQTSRSISKEQFSNMHSPQTNKMQHFQGSMNQQDGTKEHFSMGEKQSNTDQIKINFYGEDNDEDDDLGKLSQRQMNEEELNPPIEIKYRLLKQNSVQAYDFHFKKTILIQEKNPQKIREKLKMKL